MCLAVVALDAHPRYRLVLAANRDEYHARPAAPAAWGHAAPFTGILAGRDLTAGGTWLGVRRDGGWALVTNVRDGVRPSPVARSRGELVPLALKARDPDLAPGALSREDVAAYNGFNLLAGAVDRAAYASNRFGTRAPLPAGVHGLSNGVIDSGWPKLARLQQRLARWLEAPGDDTANLFEALADRTLAADAELPSTGVSLEWERLLSAPFIVGDAYGTRCSTVLTIDRDGRARFQERSFAADGAAVGDVVESFTLR